jgi:hypothetical protein
VRRRVDHVHQLADEFAGVSATQVNADALAGDGERDGDDAAAVPSDAITREVDRVDGEELGGRASLARAT